MIRHDGADQERGAGLSYASDFPSGCGGSLYRAQLAGNRVFPLPAPFLIHIGIENGNEIEIP